MGRKISMKFLENSQNRLVNITDIFNSSNYPIIMNGIATLRQASKLVKLSSQPNTQLPSLIHLSTLCKVDSFHHTTKLAYKQKHRSSGKINQSNLALLCSIIATYPMLFSINLMLSLITVGTYIGEPFINNLIKQIISRKFQSTDSASIVLQVVCIFIGYRLMFCIINTTSDFVSLIYGTKIYSNITYRLIKAIKLVRADSDLIARIEDDSERLLYLFSSFFNTANQLIQSIVLSSLLISKLPSHSVAVGVSYWTFVIITFLVAYYAARVNLVVMRAKEKRIEFGTASKHKIMEDRKVELKHIRKLMVLDGIGHVLPWLFNVSLMVLIYGFTNLENQQKFLVLTIFGMLRPAISSLVVNFNIFAISWSSLTRIAEYLNSISIKHNQPDKPLTQEQQIQASLLQADSYNQVNKLDGGMAQRNSTSEQRKQFPLTSLFSIINRHNSTLFSPLLMSLIVLVLAGAFLYNYCAKSILRGESVLAPFNISILLLELVAPMLLFAYICYCNLNVSSAVYDKFFSSSHSSNGAPDEIYSVSKLRISNEEMNRLSGDIKLLDRQLYSCSYSCILRATTILSSLAYSIVIVSDALLSLICTVLVLMIILWIGWLCGKLMMHRKQCYRKQAIQKGYMLAILAKLRVPIKAWKHVYIYKYFGFAIQTVFIVSLQLVLTMLTAFIIVIALISDASVQSTSVLIMQISQLDSLFLYFFIQVIFLHKVTAAACRCFDMLSSRQQVAL